ncbi:hypothetical protein P175DRAFT_090724 [Aspergillus ochraceoroseus IBT 24754]|uniref:Uncharacterized protein n=2 Tax=Aspergillus ochraceoroseus TaxID=138278 RepID=A0A2T5LMI9_9EURO|nr:uncharacterized protein P175DRAFT_090724 [Aspergillus ochraceoroseus IBT 24754]KKK25018.1 hypothetical protein AOCH_000625 [Aspergillus ochraceoroseus]PTU17491.1 hypothetical protein P175DRAFT_090724 [Aspergillus ochraceoroseus IBT 24754]
MEQDGWAPIWRQSSSNANTAHKETTFQPNRQPSPKISPAEELEGLWVEDVPLGDYADNAGIQLVKPYAIEEPDAESTYEHDNPTVSPFKGDGLATPQGDLVDSMEGLHCDSDNPDPQVMISPKRGRKRKPTNPLGISRSEQRYTSKSAFDVYEGPTLSPKRPRRKSKRSKENLRASLASNRTRALSGSSATSVSTDFSGATVPGEPTASDEMDLD